MWDYGGMRMSGTHQLMFFSKPHGLNTNLSSLLHGLTHNVLLVSFFKDSVLSLEGKVRGSFAPFKAIWDGGCPQRVHAQYNTSHMKLLGKKRIRKVCSQQEQL